MKKLTKVNQAKVTPEKKRRLADVQLRVSTFQICWKTYVALVADLKYVKNYYYCYYYLNFSSLGSRNLFLLHFSKTADID